jgi:hypothetical protein
MCFVSLYRLKDETINDANDRAIVTAAEYFQSILSEASAGNVMFITNDVANRVSHITVFLFFVVHCETYLCGLTQIP